MAEAKCRYRAPVRYDEEVLVRTQLLNVRESVVHFGYELRRAEDGALLAEGETTHIVTDAAMKIAEMPDKYMTVFCDGGGEKAIEPARNWKPETGNSFERTSHKR